MTSIVEYLSCTVENGVATLTLNHPPVNALTLPILAQLEAALDGLVKDDRVNVMILTGTGRIFIAGADIKVIAAIASSDEGKEMALRGQAVLNKLKRVRNPLSQPSTALVLGED